MAAKLREKDGFWWVVVHHKGRRKWKKIGKDKREAQKVVHRVNAELALGQFVMEPAQPVRTVGEALWEWYETYLPTLAPRTAQLSKSNIKRHLVPAFGMLRVNELEEHHILEFIRSRTIDAKRPLAGSTLRNILADLRRALNVAVERGEIQRHPCRNLGRLLAQVERQQSAEAKQADAWSRAEVVSLLEVAKSEDARFYPFLATLLYTGMRKGEARALRWRDVDFSGARITIRRAYSGDQVRPPKSGKGRTVALAQPLASILRDVLSERRAQCLRYQWPEVPELVFCSETGGPLDDRNVSRSWGRVRRKAQKRGVRPLRLHDARHTFASIALASGKSVVWVAAQLGHHSSTLTLGTYSHFMPNEETDLSFLDFAASDGTPAAPALEARLRSRKSHRETPRRDSRKMVELGGIEPPTLRLPA